MFGFYFFFCSFLSFVFSSALTCTRGLICGRRLAGKDLMSSLSVDCLEAMKFDQTRVIGMTGE